jgi:NAD(P)-dependent dehydrogenase (short-subunit alcohol dehydrogenase family)
MSKIVLITGANRGIGLELVRYYAARNDRPIGVCRHATEALREAAHRVIDDVDVASDAGLERLKEKTADMDIDVLINNAGILRFETLDALHIDGIREQFEVNALGPLRVTHTLLEKMGEGSKVACITSRMGSIADNTSGSRYGYRMSKAALNMAAVSLAHDLKPQGIAVGIVHPGFVQTDMVGGNGDITPDVAAERIAARIEELNLQNTGTFWHANGEVLPW